MSNQSRKKLIKQNYFEATISENELEDSSINILQKAQVETVFSSNASKKKLINIQEQITPMKQQYFEVKGQYSNSIILFQRGQFYQAYDQDAEYINQMLGYQWRNIIKRVIGIPEQNLEDELIRLISLGQSIVVCQQVEDSIAHQERIKKLKDIQMRKQSDQLQIIERKIIGIYSNGTIGLGCLCNKSLELVDYNHIISISSTFNTDQYDITVFDTISKRAILTSTNDINQIFTQYPPSLLLISKYDLILIKATGHKSSIVQMLSLNQHERSLNLLIEFLQQSFFLNDTIPQVTFYQDNQMTDITLQITNRFFKDLQIPNQFINQNSQIQETFQLKKNLIQQLDIIDSQVKSERKQSSLFSILNHTITKEGEQILQSWILNPLVNIQDIQYRQYAIEDLLKIMTNVNAVREEFKQIQNFQKRLNWLYGQAQSFYIARAEICYKPFLFLKQFLRDLRNVIYQLQIRLISCRDQFKSKMLKELLNDQILKLTRQKVEEISDLILWQGSELTIPSPSSNPMKEEYDSILGSLERIQTQIYEEVLRIRGYFSNSLEIVELNTTKNQHEIEIPNELSKQIKQEFQLEISSVRQGCIKYKISQILGFRRYKTSIIQEMNQREFIQQSKLKSLMSEFQKKILSQFIEQRSIWNSFLKIIGILDVLFSLSIYSQQGLIKPQFTTELSLQAIKFNHPLLLQLIGDRAVPNDIVLDQERFCAIISGCNGSGKTTIMRAIGLIIIIAQIGCYVPCQLLKFNPFKQIFVKMGAIDYLTENRSTFYQELLEVKEMIGQKHVLLLIDELGLKYYLEQGQGNNFYRWIGFKLCHFDVHFKTSGCDYILYQSFLSNAIRFRDRLSNSMKNHKYLPRNVQWSKWKSLNSNSQILKLEKVFFRGKFLHTQFTPLYCIHKLFQKLIKYQKIIFDSLMIKILEIRPK